MVLAGLLVLLGAAGVASAVHPSPAGWSPASYGGAGQDLALAADDAILGFATADPGTNPNDQDLHFLTADGGPLASQGDDELPPDNEGKDHVVASDDGSALAAGSDVGASGPNLWYFARDDARNGTMGTDTEVFARGVTALDITPDGSHLAVATTDDNDGVVRLYEVQEDALGTPVFEHETEGPLRDVAVGDQGQWVVAGGKASGNQTGTVLLFEADAGNQPVDDHVVEEDLSSVVRTVALTPDARLAVAGTAAGRVAAFARSGSSLSPPNLTDLEGSQVSDIGVHPDGEIVAAGATDGVHMLERSGGIPNLVPRWTHKTPAAVESLASSENVTHTVAAVPGASGGVYAYHHSRSEPIWTLEESASLVDVDAEPANVVVARGSNVSAYLLDRGLEAGFPTAGDELADAPRPTPTVRAGATTTTVDVGVRTLGSVTDTYEVEATIGGDWNVSVERSSVEVLPNETRSVPVRIQPGNVAADRYNVTFTATSVQDPGISANITIPVRVQGEADVHMRISGANATRPVGPGDNPVAFFTVENRGNRETTPSVRTRVSPSGSPTWSVEAPDRIGPLGPGEKTSFQITTNVPGTAADGDTRDINVTLQSDSGSVGRTIRYVVNPFRDVSLEIQPNTRFVNETIRGHYNMTVSNEGSVDTDFQFIFTRTASGTPGWTVLATREPFVVESGESRTLPMQVVPPTNAVVDDRVLVNVQVTPRDLADQLEPEVEDNVTVSAVFKDLSEDDDGPPIDVDEIPGPGLGAVGALAAAGALASRRHGSRTGVRGETCTARTSETYKNMQAGTGEHPSTGPRVAGRSPPGDTP
jgi:hypothetical protein